MDKRKEVLERLQSIKKKIGEQEKHKEHRRKDIKEKEIQIEDKKTLSEQKSKDYKTAQKEIHNKELDLKTDEDQISKFNIQLNQIKTNKEYNALRSEIGCKEADKSLLEDSILNLMSKLETLDNENKELLEVLKQDEEKLKDFIKSIEEDIKKTDEDIARLLSDQEKYSSLLDEETLYHYKRLSNKKEGTAIEEVIDNACGGCFMSITMQTLNSLMGEKELVLCPNCKRILFLNNEGP